MKKGTNLFKMVAIGMLFALEVVSVGSLSNEKQFSKNVELSNASAKRPNKKPTKKPNTTGSKLIDKCSIGDYVNYDSESCDNWIVFNKNTATGEVILIAEDALFDIRPFEVGFDNEDLVEFSNYLTEKRTSSLTFETAYNNVLTESKVEMPNEYYPELIELVDFVSVEKDMVNSKELDVYNSDFASSYALAPNYNQIEKALKNDFLQEYSKGLSTRNNKTELTYWASFELQEFEYSENTVLLEVLGYWVAEYLGKDSCGTENVASVFGGSISSACSRSYNGIRPIVYLKNGVKASGSARTGWTLVK